MVAQIDDLRQAVTASPQLGDVLTDLEAALAAEDLAQLEAAFAADAVVPPARTHATVELGAIPIADGATLETLYQHRKEVAHELPRLVVDPAFDVKPDLLVEAGRILTRIGVFWGRIWCAESDGVADEGIQSGSSILYDYVLSLCLPADEAEGVAS